jgi:hypothetical protein
MMSKNRLLLEVTFVQAKNKVSLSCNITATKTKGKKSVMIFTLLPYLYLRGKQQS